MNGTVLYLRFLVKKTWDLTLMGKKQEVKVTFQPSGRTIYVLPGTLMLEAAGRAGLILQTPCGGAGTCGKCKVRVLEGECPPSAAANDLLTSEQIEKGYRLACQAYIEEDSVIDVPLESRFEATDQILTRHGGKQTVLRPVVRKQSFKLNEPSSADALSDASRLRSEIGEVNIPHRLLHNLPGFLRSNDWHGIAVIAQDRLLAIEKGDTTGELYGVAVDLGTTTMVGTLFDLASGKEKAVHSAMNPQVAFGDDVIARISRVRENHGALAEMQQEILNAMNSLVQSLGDKGGVNPQHIYELVLAGNSTMQELFCGLDPSALGEVPFVPAFDEALTIPSATFGLKLNAGAEVFVFPQLGGFVGGDTVAGMLASGMDKVNRPTLLVDIGTNGEIVLAHNGTLQATSTAAGPAFEGARIVQGMRATAGAIEKVVIAEDVALNVIGNTAPVGICGTALIDAVAELLRQGLIEETGRIRPATEAPKNTPESLLSRLETKDNETNFLLASAAETGSGEPIYLWQKDVRELQLATGAIRAGINIMLRRVDIAPEDLGSVLLAGAFGNFIRRTNARRIGLLPQISCERINFIGNAASLGAKHALLSEDERERAENLRKQSEHVDLSLDPEFQMEFGMAMMFPAGDVDS
ncbi:MAG: ASKHA domain-containing protein [Lentisphaeria bacterium]